ncbi:CATRA conflict system CASPASE/TPR repeat-associated protein [Parafrankia sp. FMc6]|uniref:CATRA conflict system CASPASE/TPR repeat-associated protein n=1 Tax=Parafrankia soli TaxID=2599596 RepID=UPI0034D6CE44
MASGNDVAPGGDATSGDDLAAGGGGQLLAPELVVHVFAPTGGPHADDSYRYLLGVWQRCGELFGITAPIHQLRVPAVPPSRLDGDPTRLRAPLAASSRPGGDVYQMLLRREHDVLCLSVILAPPDRSGRDWPALSRRWDEAAADPPVGLLAVAELFQCRLADPHCQHVAATAELAAICRQTLPTPTPRPAMDTTGITTPQGFAVWEIDQEDDTRPRRRIVVVAPHARDAELSAWTWTRGGPGGMAMTPFARYLMHAAKVRYYLRLWSGGAPVRAQRHDTDAAVAASSALFDGTFMAGPAGQGGPSAENDTAADAVTEHLTVLRREIMHLSTTATQLTEIRRSVEIAATNMAAIAGPADEGGLFADDSALTQWFARQLDHDHFYASATLERARTTLEAMVSWVAARTPAQNSPAPEQSDTTGGVGVDDLLLTGAERASLLTELARVFPTDQRAQTVLSLVGISRGRRPSLDVLSPETVWNEVLTECENGVVEAPFRRLLAAVLQRYPHNRVFRELAGRHHLAPPPAASRRLP